MNAPPSATRIVVGIDGSKEARRAAQWAALEAASQDAVLRLVYVIESVSDRQENIDRAQRALHKAWNAIADTDIDVKVESEVVSGRPADCLIQESRHAAMVCVGYRGMHDSPDGPRGATAIEVARQAVGTVAIIHRPHAKGAIDRRKWIVVVLDESASATEVLQATQNEATLRHAPILVLESWSHSNAAEHPRHPIHSAVARLLRSAGEGGVQVVMLPKPGHLANLLQQSACIDQLFVAPGDHTALVDELTNDQIRRALRRSDCSLLIIR